jgi:hypothetical protein
VAFSADGRRAVVGGGDRLVHVVEIPSLRDERSFDGHTSIVRGVAFAPDGVHVVSGARDGTTRLWRVDSPASMVLVSGRGEWAAFDEEGFFDASRRGGSLVAAVEGQRGFQIDQLAVKNNRPDLLLARVAEGSPDLIANFAARHERRLAKLGLSEAALASSFLRLPSARIVSLSARGKSVDLLAELGAPASAALSYDVYVNDVPLFGPGGRRLPAGAGRVTERVELTGGSNRIEVSARSDDGLESLRDFRFAEYAPHVDGDLYYVGLGVTHYRNPTYDLTYAHKDALDLADTLRLSTGMFRAVHATALIDGQVTVEGVRRAKDLLRGATVDDTVVVFVAGHGLYARDVAAEYYFGTWELDLERLAETAAPYALVEDLLQGIAPRRKLLLLDTCHSGEPDGEGDVAPRGNLVARGFRGLELEVPKARRWVFDRDRYIYNDLSRRTGAIVLSSSTGGERSWESAEIQNGVFTEEILRALTTDVADADRIGRLSTEELRAYVLWAVPGRTDGQQHPTVDRDNLYQVFDLPIVKAARPILDRGDPLARGRGGAPSL